jgi:hypothetical protein
MMRVALGCLVLLCATALASCATARGDKPAAPRPLIERSYLVAPEKIGELVLEDVQYDPANRYSGARFRYGMPGHQETRFDLFVYPAGRSPQATAVAAGMKAFREDLKAAEDAGVYRDVRILGEEDFALDPDKARASTPAKGADMDARLVAIMNGASPMGRRLRMEYLHTPGDIAMHSNGYLFHRQLFFFKARISAARDRIAAKDFLPLADDAARAMVAAVDAFNLGGCANQTITLDPDADPDALAEALVASAAEGLGENCITQAGDADLAKKSRGARVVTIEFAADDWKAE